MKRIDFAWFQAIIMDIIYNVWINNKTNSKLYIIYNYVYTVIYALKHKLNNMEL